MSANVVDTSHTIDAPKCCRSSAMRAAVTLCFKELLKKTNNPRLTFCAHARKVNWAAKCHDVHHNNVLYLQCAHVDAMVRSKRGETGDQVDFLRSQTAASM